MADTTSQHESTDNAGQTTDMKVGDILRRTREHYGRTVEEVEAALRIRATQIIALEENNPKGLPGRVYAVGVCSLILGISGA